MPVNRITVYAHRLCGAITACGFAFRTFIGLSVFCGIFGFLISATVCLSSVRLP